MHHSGRGDATLVIEVLVESPGRVGGIGPSRTNAVECAGRAHILDHLTFVQNILVTGDDIEAERIPFKTGTVVGSENDQRILKLPGAFEVVDDAADLLIEPVNHGRVNCYASGEVEASIFRQSIPRRIHSGFGFTVVSPARAGAELSVFRHDAELLHTREAFGPNLIPTSGSVVSFSVSDDLQNLFPNRKLNQWGSESYQVAELRDLDRLPDPVHIVEPLPPHPELVGP